MVQMKPKGVAETPGGNPAILPFDAAAQERGKAAAAARAGRYAPWPHIDVARTRARRNA